MENKADASLSNALLLITVAVYVAVLAALFAGMAATKPTAAQAVMDWAKDYGSIIAGLPVIVALFIAKDQLDASRLQHEAATKLEFKDELYGLQIATEVASSYRTPKIFRLYLYSPRKKISDGAVESVAKSGSPEVIQAFSNLEAVVNDGATFSKEKNFASFMTGDTQFFDDDETLAAKAVLSAVKDRKEFLRQFLPNLV